MKLYRSLMTGVFVALIAANSYAAAELEDKERQKIENLLEQVEEAQVDGSWSHAANLLSKLKEMPVYIELDDKEFKFGIEAMTAWVDLKRGKLSEAEKTLAKASDINVQLSYEDHAALNDTHYAIRLAKRDELPESENRVVLGGKRYNMQGVQQDAKNVFKAINARVDKLLKNYMETSSVIPPFTQPVPPVLEKGEFEKTPDFLARVDKAQSDYEDRVKNIRASYERAVESAKRRIERRGKLLPEMRRFYTQWVMNAFIGKPRLKNVKYVADEEIFLADITARYNGKNVFDHKIFIEFPDPQKAQGYKSTLVNSEPLLVFRLDEAGLSLTHFLLDATDRVHVAELTDADTDLAANTKYVVPTLDLTDMLEQATIGASAMNMASAQVASMSIDPEIRKLKKKLSEARQNNLAAKRKERLMAKYQAELDALESHRAAKFDDDLKTIIANAPKSKLDPNKYAIVIGIDRYAETENVPFAERSAKAFSEAAEKVLGVPADNIMLLTDKEATGTNIKVRISSIASRMTGDSTLYFYFAGHGIPAQTKSKAGQPFILPYDLSPGFVDQAEDFMLTNIWKQLTSGHNGRVVAFMDSCFSGMSDNKLVFEGVAPSALRREETKVSNDNLLVFSAGNSHQFANQYKEKGHRMFSYYLLRGLVEGKNNPDELNGYLQARVTKESMRIGPSYKQTPEIKGNVDGGIL